MRTFAVAVMAVAVLGSGSPFVSSQSQQLPAFKSGVDLLTVQATVLDRAGRPVTDLTAEDFSVTVEGKPRKVLFARYRGGTETTTAGGGSAASPVAAHVDNTQTAGGRLVMFVVDRDSIKSGSEKAILESSSLILDALSPADAVGVVSVPGEGVDPTRDHSGVREELKRIAGSQPSPGLSVSDFYLSWTEALAFERADGMMIKDVVERECRPADDRCQKELVNYAKTFVFAGRAHARTVLQVLEGTLTSFQKMRGPRHVVLLSGGQAFDQELLIHYNDFARAAARARITLHAVHIDQPLGDVAERRVQASPIGGRDMATGLTTMAGMTGGAYYSGVGRATGAFVRIRTEIANDYELGLETLPTDANGKPQDVSVKVNRPNLAVRTPKQVLLAKNAAVEPKDPVLALLGQPTDIADLPIAIASYVTRGEDPTTLRLLLSAEFGTPVADWGYAVFDRSKLIADGRQQSAEAVGRRSIATSVQLAPGRYRIRVAAVGTDGREGVIDAPLPVGLRAADPLQLSDLIVGTAPSGRIQPQSQVFVGQRLATFLELVSRDASAIEKTRVALELIPAGAHEPVKRVLMASKAASPAVLITEAQINTTGLAPGRYTASAIALVETQVVGRVSRMFELVAEAMEIDPGRRETAAHPRDPAVTKLSDYVESYGPKTSVLVATERYRQVITPATGRPPAPRRLVAEFAIIKTADGWAGFRDVLEVDGVPVADRLDRLVRLASAATQDSSELQRIAEESARYNVGPIARNLNVPTMALFLFSTKTIDRFTFSRRGEKRVAGGTVLEFAFRESTRPTLVRTRKGADVPIEGIVWFEPVGGTVTRTYIKFRGFADELSADSTALRETGELILRQEDSFADMDVKYRLHEAFSVWLPATMEEQYQGPLRIGTDGIVSVKASTRATYENYRRFSTGGRLKDK